jgi:inosine-uridine nucleoside N-ribohydrolase
MPDITTQSAPQRAVPLISIALALTLAGCAAPGPSIDDELIAVGTPVPVILDVDMAHDDMFAALFLLAHPGVDVLAITVSGTGEAHCEPGVANALGLAALSGQPDIPVACGPETPLSGTHEFPAQWRAGADSAYGVPIPTGGTPAESSAQDLIVRLAHEAVEPVTIVAVGPLTNIAAAILEEPEIVDAIAQVFVMGGALEVDGNVGNSGVGIANAYAEWNIYIDPVAADVVLGSGIPVTLVPLDATQQAPVTRGLIDALGEVKATRPADLVHALLTANLDFVDSGGFHFWDSLTAAIFTDESIAEFDDVRVRVITEEGPDVGRTALDEAGERIRVVTDIDRERFESVILTVWNWDQL